MKKMVPRQKEPIATKDFTYCWAWALLGRPPKPNAAKIVLPVCMPTKQLQELKATASMRPDVKKQVMMTAPIQLTSSSSLLYVVAARNAVAFSMASMSSEFGEGVGVRSASFFAAGLGLGLLDTFGVLFNVGASELNFCRSMFDIVASR